MKSNVIILNLLMTFQFFQTVLMNNDSNSNFVKINSKDNLLLTQNIPPLSLATNSINTQLQFAINNPSIPINPINIIQNQGPNQILIPQIPIQSVLPPGRLISPGIIGNYNEPDFSENKVCPEKNTCISCQNALYNLKFRENGQCEFNKCLNKVSFIK
jgi:hypothetical protein